MNDGTGMVELLAAVSTRTEQIVRTLEQLDVDELRSGSQLPDWDRLTIACHLRYGAEALTSMSRATLVGEPASYYPEGRDAQRSRTLRPEPDETPAAVVRSLAARSEDLHGLWDTIDLAQWRFTVEEPADNRDLGPLPLARLPLLRLTEVEVHGTDLGLDLADWSRAFVETALPFRIQWLNARRVNHRAFEREISGSWLLVATDGPSHRITVHGDRVDARRATPSTEADAIIEATSRDLLALLLGRPMLGRVTHAGDERLAESFSLAFPGP